MFLGVPGKVIEKTSRGDGEVYGLVGNIADPLQYNTLAMYQVFFRNKVGKT